MGRLSYLLKNGGISDEADLMKRVQLADALMYLTRGQPVTYYGDEQGFIGSGGDKDARQDMFATKTAQYVRPRTSSAAVRARRTGLTPPPRCTGSSAPGESCARRTPRSPTARRSIATRRRRPASTRSPASIGRPVASMWWR